jgi:hypothetical protein
MQRKGEKNIDVTKIKNNYKKKHVQTVPIYFTNPRHVHGIIFARTIVKLFTSVSASCFFKCILREKVVEAVTDDAAPIRETANLRDANAAFRKAACIFFL